MLSFIPGALIADRYRVVDLVGNDAVSDAVLAVDHLLTRYVDLVAAPAPATTPVGALFARRAETLSALRHAALPLIYDLATHEGYTVLVQQHIDGPTLAQRLAVGGSGRTVADALLRIAIVGEALGLVHDAGLCHGALRADSIVLGHDDGVFIRDLAWPRLDNARASLGVAPEVRAGAPPTPRAYVYALGTLLYDSLDMAGVGRDDPAAWALPMGVRDLIRRATSITPEHRYASGAELARAIRDLVAAADSLQQTITLPAVQATRRIPRRALALAMAAPVVAALSFWAVGGPARVAGLSESLPWRHHLSHVRRAPTAGAPALPMTTLDKAAHHPPAHPASLSGARSTGTSSMTMPIEPPTNTPGPTWTPTATPSPPATPTLAPTATPFDAGVVVVPGADVTQPAWGPPPKHGHRSNSAIGPGAGRGRSGWGGPPAPPPPNNR